MSKVKFKETQKYENKYVLIALGTVGLAAVPLGMYLLLSSEKDVMGAIILFALAFSVGFLIWWLTHLKLKVTVTEKKVKFKLSPLHFKKQAIPWEDIDRCEIIKTPEAAKWSGGNISSLAEKRYSLTGRNGLAIKTKEGEFFFIGCKNIEALRRALDHMNIS
jgi:uncharacterized membrane protein YciS (DUF1049 family)